MSSTPLRHPRVRSLCLAAGLLLAAMHAAAGTGTPAAPEAAASAPPPSAKPAKDVVIDANAAAAAPAAASAAAPAGRLVSTPHAGSAGARPPRSPYTTPVHDAAAAGALGDLGLALLRQRSQATGSANANAVASPLSVGTALGLVHAGAAGETARELATLLAPGPAGAQGFAARLPSVLARLGGKAADSPFVMASRVWVRKDLAGAVPPPYLALAHERFDADAALIGFDNADAARQLINQWTAEQTRRRIPQLLPAGALTPTTRVVVTNAVHFKSRWALPFDPKATEELPFQTPVGAKKVPTMVDERPVAQGTIDNLTVYELPFAGKAYALQIAMAPKGHTLDALEKDLAGLDMAAWKAQLEEKPCRLQLPRFAIDAPSQSLKAALQNLGVRSAFTDRADLGPLLGKAAAGTGLDDVYHAATIVIDESGGEAAAATAATVQAKSFQMPAPVCAVDRPFIFTIVHKPTGAPLFVGRVADPSQP